MMSRLRLRLGGIAIGFDSKSGEACFEAKNKFVCIAFGIRVFSTKGIVLVKCICVLNVNAFSFLFRVTMARVLQVIDLIVLLSS